MSNNEAVINEDCPFSQPVTDEEVAARAAMNMLSEEIMQLRHQLRRKEDFYEFLSKALHE